MFKIIPFAFLLVLGFSLSAQVVDTLPHMTYFDATDLRSFLRIQKEYNRMKLALQADNITPLSGATAVLDGIQPGQLSIYPDTAKVLPKDSVTTATHTRVFYLYKQSDTFFSTNVADRQKMSSILKNYYFNATNDLNGYFAALRNFNPILRPYIADAPAAGAAAPVGAANILSGIGGLNVTAFADGLAQFLVERTKDELNEAFFRKFASYLNYYPEFKTLFPNTNTFVNNFNAWEYANLLNTLKEAFDKDLKLIMANFIKLRTLSVKDCQPPGTGSSCNNLCNACMQRVDDVSKFFQKNEGLFLLSALQIGNGLLNDQKIPDILFSIVRPDFLLGYTDAAHPQAVADLKNTLQLINILSYSLKSDQTGRHYITPDEFNLLITDPARRRIYLGLLYQQIRNANNGAGINIGGLDLATLLANGNVDGFIKYITNLINQSKNVQTAYDKLVADKANAKADLSLDYAAVFDAVKILLQGVSNTVLINNQLVIPPKLSSAFELASQTLQIAHDISVKNYNAVIVGALTLLSDATQPYINDYPGLQIFNSAFLKYGSFAANVVLAKTPDDVKQAIQSFALPAGSASIKKVSYFNISLNAYVGFSYGFRNTPSKSSFTTKATNGSDSVVQLNGGKSIGVYAPVGISFSWGRVLGPKNPWSITGFVSLLDLGALVGYRFINDTAQTSNSFKVNLSDILAPGANIVIGLPNMPISVGGGIQWVPTLQRDPNTNALYNVNYSAVRWQVFIAVDLPLLNFHTSQKSLLQAKIRQP